MYENEYKRLISDERDRFNRFIFIHPFFIYRKQGNIYIYMKEGKKINFMRKVLNC